MTAERMSFKCPLCTSDFILEKKAVRSETFRCPVCQEGELESRTAELDIDRIAGALLGEPGSWVILPAPVETVSRS
jgi:peptide subunit release factor 1 (eRF1)